MERPAPRRQVGICCARSLHLSTTSFRKHVTVVDAGTASPTQSARCSSTASTSTRTTGAGRRCTWPRSTATPTSRPSCSTRAPTPPRRTRRAGRRSTLQGDARGELVYLFSGGYFTPDPEQNTFNFITVFSGRRTTTGSSPSSSSWSSRRATEGPPRRYCRAPLRRRRRRRPWRRLPTHCPPAASPSTSGGGRFRKSSDRRVNRRELCSLH